MYDDSKIMSKISIVIPIYKVEKYLERCLESVITQKGNNLEIILVDDGSPDRCPIICEEYAKKYSNIEVIHKRNGGLASAIKEGTEKASGEYIAYVDSDDWLEKEWLEKINTVINEHPKIDVILFGLKRRENGRVTDCVPYGNLEAGYYDMEQCEFLKRYYMKPGYIGPTRWNKVYRREIANIAIRYYDTRISIGEDICFSAIAISEMKCAYIIKDNLINYYINTGSMTQHFNEKYLLSFNCLYEALRKYFVDSPILYYINYINMRTLINSVAKSDYQEKIRYIKNVFAMQEHKDRIKGVCSDDIDLPNRILRRLMLMNCPRLLLVASWLYRLWKKR